MPAFEELLSVSIFFPAAFCSGLLFLGSLLYTTMYFNTKENLHLSMAVLGTAGFCFVFGETMVLASGWMLNPSLGMQFHRIEQIAATLLIPGILMMLQHLLQIGDSWKRFNQKLVWFGFILFGVIFIISFVFPEIFVSQTVHREDWMQRQADHGRGKEGILYLVRDGFFGLLILYAIGCFLTDIFSGNRLRYLLLSFLGLLTAVTGAVIDVISVYTHHFYDFTPDSKHSRFVAGISVFIIFSMGAVLRKFFDFKEEAEKIYEDSRKNAEKNARQNDFIKNRIKTSSEDLFLFSEKLISILDQLNVNARAQKDAAEKAEQSAGRISSTAVTVQENISEQNSEMNGLTETMNSVKTGMNSVISLTRDSLNRIRSINVNAKDGENSMKTIQETMQIISRSSAEIQGIIAIIQDISDRINLLSLNAAIEAARAGSFGKGFGVVADEISKLAEQTAGSIKSISTLIVKNDKEIRSGSQNIVQAAGTISRIILDMEAMFSRIQEISTGAENQSDDFSRMEKSAENFRTSSDKMKSSLNVQNLAVREIQGMITEIDSLAGINSNAGKNATESVRELAVKAEKINKEIELFENES
ncbi:MAG TPA: methyl-accepting chemotaxis protein [Leptospiraceae bacterium]|nr:methyl-accepting chemotaxis protein [Leptospiraceae bacterium]HNM02501.1 methyl-accepting chemotaxis protein [Leptospiraceae bacterium]HNN04353.1 methyl-accepting chemotaxis protein [Leptospiraceae bacterium]